MALPTAASHLRFRRAAGLRIDATWTNHQYTYGVGLRGRQARLAMTGQELEALLQLADFKPFARAEWTARWEAADLVHYTADPSVSRPFTHLESSGDHLADHVRVRPVLHSKGQRGAFGYMPREELLRDTTWTGVELVAQEYEAETVVVQVSGVPDLAAWRVPLGEAPWQRQLRPILRLAGMTTTTAPTDPPVGSVMWLGHAGALLRLGEASVLVDPMCFSGASTVREWQTAPPRWRVPPSLAAVVLTHGDHDHFHPETLALLPKHLPVLIPKARVARPYHVAMRRVLDILGFSTVHELERWGRFTIGDATITATPFVGEDWGLDLPQMTSVVTGPRGRVFLSSDAGAMPIEMTQIAERCGPFDFAFLGISGCAEPLVCSDDIGYGHMFGAWVDKAKRNEWTELTANPTQAADAAVVLQARHVFGYAAGGGPYVKLKYSDRGSHSDLAAALAQRGLGERAVALRACVPFSL